MGQKIFIRREQEETTNRITGCFDIDGLPNHANHPKKNSQGKDVVYFTRDISPEGLVKIYDKISKNIDGKVAIKFHTGEPHGPNILPVPMVKALWEHIPNSRLVL